MTENKDTKQLLCPQSKQTNKCVLSTFSGLDTVLVAEINKNEHHNSPWNWQRCSQRWRMTQCWTGLWEKWPVLSHVGGRAVWGCPHPEVHCVMSVGMSPTPGPHHSGVHYKTENQQTRKMSEVGEGASCHCVCHIYSTVNKTQWDSGTPGWV